MDGSIRVFFQVPEVGIFGESSSLEKDKLGIPKPSLSNPRLYGQFYQQRGIYGGTVRRRGTGGASGRDWDRHFAGALAATDPEGACNRAFFSVQKQSVRQSESFYGFGAEKCSGKFSQVLRYFFSGKKRSHSLIMKLRPAAKHACFFKSSTEVGK